MGTIHHLTVNIDRNGLGMRIISILANGKCHRPKTVNEIARRTLGRHSLIEPIARAHHLKIGLLRTANSNHIVIRPRTRQFDLEDQVKAQTFPHYLVRIDYAYAVRHPCRLLVNRVKIPSRSVLGVHPSARALADETRNLAGGA